MSTRSSHRNNWYRLGRFTLVAVLIVILLTFGYHRFEAWRNRPSQTWRLANSVTVTGFSRLAVVDDPVNVPMAEAYFIGPPPKPDPLTAVSVPSIPLHKSDPPDPEPQDTRSILAAGGGRSDGCNAIVNYDSDPRATVGLMKDEHHISVLTEQQIAEILKGTKVFIEVVLNDCGR